PGARPRLAHGRRRRVARPARRGARGQRLPAGGGRGGGARVPRDAPVPPARRGEPDPGDAPVTRVAVVAEFYPSDRDPVLGVWAHRQALAARDAGAEVDVYVLHRLVPPAASV